MIYGNSRRIKVTFLCLIIITFILLSSKITIELIDNNKDVSNQNKEMMKYNEEMSDKYKEMVNKFPFDIYLEGISVGEKSYDEISSLINELSYKKLERNITVELTKNDKYYIETKGFNELDIITNKQEILSSIKSIIKKGDNLLFRIKFYYDTKDKKVDFKLEYAFNDEKILGSFNKFEAIKLDNPVDAMYKYTNSKIIISEGKDGEKLDKIKLLELIKNDINTDKKDIVLEYPIQKISPDITTDILKNRGIENLIASFTTEYDYENKPRTENLRVATNTINGVVLQPGEIFSMNEVLGQRTIDKGYKEAPIFVNGKIRKGLGGGICQVASTLYNSVLYSNLEIIERDHHSLTVGYVPLSRDSAISWGIQDLKFKNNTDKYIFIHGRVDDKTMTFEIFGTEKDIEVRLETVVHNKIEPKVIEIPDDTLKKGEKKVINYGRVGYKSSLYKSTYKDGKLIEKIKLSTDTYGTIPKKIKVGTKE